MLNKNSTIAVIGGGRWGHVSLSEFSKIKSDHDQIVSVSGHNAASIDELITKLQPNTSKKLLRCDTVDDLLENFNVKAALVVNSPVRHYETALRLLEHNIPLLIEKPVVMHTKEAYDLVSKAKSRNVALIPALNYGYLEYIHNFGRHIAPRLSEVRSFTISWADPAGKHRFFNNIRKADGGISFIQEVMSHLWTITHTVLSESNIKMNNVENGSLENQYIFELTAGQIPGKVLLHEKAPERLRRMEVVYNDGTSSSILFTDEPGIITQGDDSFDADPEWKQRKSPLVQEYEYFMAAINSPINEIDVLRFVQSTYFMEDAYSMVTAPV